MTELQLHKYLAELELPYVKGARAGEDPARDAELRRVSALLDAPCILDQFAAFELEMIGWLGERELAGRGWPLHRL